MADEIKQTVLIDIDIEQDDADFRKLANLKGALVGLKTEQKNLEAALKAGTITQKEYNSEIVRVEALQKRTTAQYSQTQRAVTGLKNPLTQINDSLKKQNQAIQGVLPGLDRMTGGAIGAAGAIFGMVKASLAFMATPLGLFIAGVTATLAPFVTFLTQSGEGADLVTREMEGFRSVLQLVRDDLVKTGKEQKGFFDGIVEGIASSNPVLRGLIETYRGLSKAGKEYADALDDIKDAREDNSIANTKEENEVKRLLLQAKNRTLAEQDRVDLLNKALAIEATRVSREVSSAQDELSAIVTRNEARLKENANIERLGETQEEFVEKNIKAIRAFDEPLAQALIKAVDNLEKARSSGIAIEEKAQNQIDAIRDKAEQKEEKRLADDFKRSEEERKLRIENFEFQLEQSAIEFEAELQQRQAEADLDQQVKDGLTARLNTYEENRKKTLKSSLQFEKGIFEARIGLSGQFGAALIQLAGRSKILATAGVVIERAAAIAAIISNTAAANAKAVKASPTTFGQPWVGINSASAAISILATIGSAAQAISQINSAKGFARGGRIDSGTPIRRSNGDDVLITAKRREVILTENQQALLGGSRAMAKAGVPGFASGGVVGNETRLATQYATSQIDLNQMAQLLNQIQTVLVLEEFEAKQSSVNQTDRRAIVI